MLIEERDMSINKLESLIKDYVCDLVQDIWTDGFCTGASEQAAYIHNPMHQERDVEELFKESKSYKRLTQTATHEDICKAAEHGCREIYNFYKIKWQKSENEAPDRLVWNDSWFAAIEYLQKQGLR